MLTKSLHTVTAATNVAAHLARSAHYAPSQAFDLAERALMILGYEYGARQLEAICNQEADDTIVRVVKACAKLLADTKPAKAAQLNSAPHMFGARS